MHENDIKDKLKEKIDKEALAKDSAGDFDMTSQEAKSITDRKKGIKLTENQMFDALEVCSYAILQNLRRHQCMDIVVEYFQEQGISEGGEPDQISRHRLLQIYKNARNQLFTRKVKDIEKERNRFVRDMHRIALKSEHAMDYGNAIKCLKEIAEVTGVFREQDDSKITLNFLPAPKKE